MQKSEYLYKKGMPISISTYAMIFICIGRHIGNWYVMVGGKMFHYAFLTLKVFYHVSVLIIPKSDK